MFTLDIGGGTGEEAGGICPHTILLGRAPTKYKSPYTLPSVRSRIMSTIHVYMEFCGVGIRETLLC